MTEDLGQSGFDTEVMRVARQKNGDPVTPELFWNIVIALDRDGQARHEEMKHMLTQHILREAFRRLVGLIVVLLSIILIAFALFEWYDQEQLAAVTSLALTIALVIGGWMISKKTSLED